MPGPQDGEMPVVKSCELRFVETLDNCENSSVNEAQGEVTITVEKLSHPSKVIRLQVNDSQDSGLDVRQKIQERIRMKPLTG